ncbi:MAG: site-2 protease family protein [Candidatus Roizmanbacteria bacterium]|nr:site-2 protease family protein [Candidatus Roizmanbacteria bacterium]MCR4312754.1 site-2 protease family protein [Candidatus Roizmanbacteria bacterium]
MISYLFSNPLLFIFTLFSLLIAITIHEFSHAWVADYLGDPTPRLQGRLKLNPLVHIDNVGMIFLLLFGFGWGKPVQFDPYNLKDPRRDAALISIAGPSSNFILAIILSLLLKLFIILQLDFMLIIGSLIFVPMIQMNILLGVFNLLPIHPMDGFKIVEGILPEEKAREWSSLQRFGMIFLIMLIFPIGGSSMLSGILMPAVRFLFNLLVPGKIM